MAPVALLIASLSLLLRSSFAIPVDNGLDGDPEVQCGSTELSVVFSTRNPFEGHVYVKGQFTDDGCKSTGDASISLDITGDCNVLRERSLEPKGVFVTTTLIIQFHPLFVTKVDQAIRFRCFYMEADKTVSQDLEVSPLTPELQTSNVPMPTCQYDILDAPGGNPVKYVLVGEAVYHKWTCTTNTLDTFCMVVHSCTVDDGAGDNVQLLNEEGCAVDKYLLRNLEYPTDLMAGQETHVFKFADRNQLFFQCQIAITIKEPGSECPLPTCPSLARGARLRKTRSADPTELTAGVLDVIATVDALDLVPDVPTRPNLSLPHRVFNVPESFAQATNSDEFCLSPIIFGTLAAGSLLMFVVAIVSTVVLCIRKEIEKQ